MTDIEEDGDFEAFNQCACDSEISDSGVAEEANEEIEGSDENELDENAENVEEKEEDEVSAISCFLLMTQSVVCLS